MLKAELDRIVSRLATNEILLVCSENKCPRHTITKKEDYEPKEAVILVAPCPWHTEDTEMTRYLDNKFKTVEVK